MALWQLAADMSETDLAEVIYERAGLSGKKSDKAADAVVETIKHSLRRGENVKIWQLRGQSETCPAGA